ncbi:MAG: TlpA disulfide reductase family protein [Dermatophilaceae bacterium]
MSARPRVAAVAAVAALILAGCASDPNSLAEQAKGADRKGYAAGDGTITQLAPDQRAGPVTLSGATVDGGRWSLAEQGRGKVVVVNVWGAWCAPCTTEMPALQRVWSQVQAAGKDVAFVGVAVKEAPETSLSFLTRNGITYPSISDQASGGTPTLDLGGAAPATPTTLVLDARGRIAARVLGVVTEATLRGLVDDALAGT